MKDIEFEKENEGTDNESNESEMNIFSGSTSVRELIIMIL